MGGWMTNRMPYTQDHVKIKNHFVSKQGLKDSLPGVVRSDPLPENASWLGWTVSGTDNLAFTARR